LSEGPSHPERHEFSTAHQAPAESPNPLTASIIFTNTAWASPDVAIVGAKQCVLDVGISYSDPREKSVPVDERLWLRQRAPSVAEEWPPSWHRALIRLSRRACLALLCLLTHLLWLRLLGLVIQIRLHLVVGHSFSRYG
jgi:hypothetical protein